jgi:predicted TIM-barrel fold metal-dependent hydrolase
MFLFDADSHYYEPSDCCTRYIDAEFRDRTVWVDHAAAGEPVYVGREPLRYLGINPTAAVPPPGALEAFFTNGKNDLDRFPVGMINPREMPPFQQRDARLTLMGEQNLDAVLLLPTLGVTFEYQLRHDMPAHNATVTAFNKWLEDDWGYGADGKIFGVPLLSLEDPEWAIAELERVIGVGAKFILLRCGPVQGRSPADPIFDPFWARCEEAGLPIVFHVGNDGFVDLYASSWSEDPAVSLGRYSPFQMYTSQGDRPIADTLAALVLHNLFGRFPGLRAVTVENGSDWVHTMLHDMDKAARKGRLGTQLGGALSDLPSEIFKQHVYVQPYYEEDLPALVGAIGAHRVLFGSDFPHPEGLADPQSFVKSLNGLSADDVERIMGGNMAELVGLKTTVDVSA